MQREPGDLKPFLFAQKSRYRTITAELRAGEKETHWMWFVFPILRGLGRSNTARYFALHDVLEARCYLDHPVLGARLRECSSLVMEASIASPEDIFGNDDAWKLHACMTLFDHIAPDEVFDEVLQRHFAGRFEKQTLALLDRK